MKIVATMAAQQSRPDTVKKEELLVFGYSCKLFRNSEKSAYIEAGQHLIPWMGDSALMIDRYDVRGALYDLESAMPAEGGGGVDVKTEAEQKEEELCEYERYLALYHDLDAAQEQEDEERKRLQVELGSGASDYNQVGFSYNIAAPGTPAASAAVAAHQVVDPAQQQQQQQQAVLQHTAEQNEQHPHGYTPKQDDDFFIPPPTLVLPPGLVVPESIKQNKIILKTAKFIAKQGSQMEIVLKAKQANNHMFSFLSFDNKLNQYYKHLISLMRAGKYHEEKEPEKSPTVPEASFNPPDAAPGQQTPKTTPSKKPPPPDCSYSKLISKIRENQAKSGVGVCLSDSRSQSPVTDVSTPVTASLSASNALVVPATTAVTSTAVTTVSAANVTTPLVNLTGEVVNVIPVVTVTAAAIITSTPVAVQQKIAVVPGTPASTPSTQATPKSFTGLVDYPSFNRTNDDTDSLSETDSEDYDFKNRHGKQNGNMINTKYNEHNSVSKTTVSNANNKEIASKEKNKQEVRVGGSDEYKNITWPSPTKQMAIDKIACYIVKNGQKFEDAVKSRGDPRFGFLVVGDDHHAYFLLKRDLYREVFCPTDSTTNPSSPSKQGAITAPTPAATTQSGCDMLSVVEAAEDADRNRAEVGEAGERTPAISFSIRQRPREQETQLPPTSFPLESSSSEEDPEELPEEERLRRELEKKQRREWRRMKREQFKREKQRKMVEETERKKNEDRKLEEETAGRSKMDEGTETRRKENEMEKRKKEQQVDMFEKDLKEKKREQNEMRKRDEEMKQLLEKDEMNRERLRRLEEQENESGDEDMYDIFKYAQETEDGRNGAGLSLSAETVTVAPAQQRLRRKKAAAFLSKLKGAAAAAAATTNANPPIIGPMLPPEMTSEMMDISPTSSTAGSPSRTPSRTPRSPRSPSPKTPRSCLSPATPPLPQSLPLETPPPPKSQNLPNNAQLLPPPVGADLATILIGSPTSSLPGKTRGTPKTGGVLAAAVTTLLSGGKRRTTRGEKRPAEMKTSRRHKKHRRDESILSPSPERSSIHRRHTAVVSAKKKKHRHHKKHHHHHHHHHSSLSQTHSSYHRKSHSAVHKKKAKSSSLSRPQKLRKKKSKKHRSVSVSSVSSISSSSSSRSRSRSRSSSRSRSRSSSIDSSRSFSSRTKRSRSDDDVRSGNSDMDVQVISSSSRSSSSSRASSVLSVRSNTAGRPPSSTCDSAAAEDVNLEATTVVAGMAMSSGTTSPGPLPPASKPPTPTPAPALKLLPSTFDMKTSSAIAKITEGLRAKVHALMEKKKVN